MATSNRSNPVEDGVWIEPVELTPDDSVSNVNQIPPNCQTVAVGSNVNNDQDFLVLPDLDDVPEGHTLTLLMGSENCELKTPASSSDKINTADCSSTTRFQLTATDILKITKMSTTAGWMAKAWTNLGASRAAIVVGESLSPSLSPSISSSLSPSLSSSLSASISPSKSPSLSPSISPSPSASASYSPSLSPSKSPSLSPSLSASLSPSISPSASASASSSPSISPSTSASVSVSPSISPSVSPS